MNYLELSGAFIVALLIVWFMVGLYLLRKAIVYLLIFSAIMWGLLTFYHGNASWLTV